MSKPTSGSKVIMLVLSPILVVALFLSFAYLNRLSKDDAQKLAFLIFHRTLTAKSWAQTDFDTPKINLSGTGKNWDFFWKKKDSEIAISISIERMTAESAGCIQYEKGGACERI
jgi:hypothetical protein